MSNQEIIRRRQYCQIVKEITGSDQYLVVGIDVAKEKHHAFMGSATGKSLFRKLIFENNLDGFSRLLKTAEAIKSQNSLCKIVYGLEPTGNYHKPLARHLIHCDCNVVLVSGVAVKRNRELLNGRWDKNDTKCAANIADLVSREDAFTMTVRHQDYGASVFAVIKKTSEKRRARPERARNRPDAQAAQNPWTGDRICLVVPWDPPPNLKPTFLLKSSSRCANRFKKPLI